MNYLFFILVMVSVSLGCQAEKYQDSPIDISPKVDDLLAPYRLMALQTLDTFNNKLATKDDRKYYIITRIYESDRMEQIFVRVKKFSNNSYYGNIANNSTGAVNFKNGAPIVVKRDDVLDWTIVNAAGKEEGNLLGKALDLIQVGKAVFILEVQTENQKYVNCKVISVMNPATKQDITELVSESILKKIGNIQQHILETETVSDPNKKYTYLIVNYPSWEPILKSPKSTDI